MTKLKPKRITLGAQAGVGIVTTQEPILLGVQVGVGIKTKKTIILLGN